MCHSICNPQWTHFEGVLSESIIPIHSYQSEWNESTNVSQYMQSTVDTIWRCFEWINYFHSLHIRVNGTNRPMCHGICNAQWTKFEGVLSESIIPVHSISEWMELIDQCVTASAIHSAHNLKVFQVGWLFRSLHIRVNGTNRPLCQGICNPQCTQFEGVLSWSIIPVHSVLEWMELIDQCVMVSAIHSAHNFFTQYAVYFSSNAWYVLNTGLTLMYLYHMAW